jgi:MFS family permease
LGLALPFIAAVCIILSMYGGGFATIPAYLADLFGSQLVGAIHGRILTAWSVAGVAGPMLIAALRQAQIDGGVAKNLVYDRTLYIMAGLLAVGLVCNLLIRPVESSRFTSGAVPEPSGSGPAQAGSGRMRREVGSASSGPPPGSQSRPRFSSAWLSPCRRRPPCSDAPPARAPRRVT